jgi:hypothetical protein
MLCTVASKPVQCLFTTKSSSLVGFKLPIAQVSPSGSIDRRQLTTRLTKSSLMTTVYIHTIPDRSLVCHTTYPEEETMSATEHSNQPKTTRTDDHHGSTKHLPARDQAAQQNASKDKKPQVLASSTTSQQSEPPATGIPSPSAPASAAAVNAVMGPPPPKDEKIGGRWERWRRDRKEARELGMPSQESSGRWGVKNFAA